jgi:hypothetical protein
MTVILRQPVGRGQRKSAWSRPRETEAASGDPWYQPPVRPWRIIDSVDTPEGVLQIRQRGESDFLMTIGGRVLMSRMAHRSEDALAELTCGPARRPLFAPSRAHPASGRLASHLAGSRRS